MSAERPKLAPSVGEAYSQARDQGLAAVIQFLGILCIAVIVFLFTRRPIPEVLATTRSTGDRTADAARDVLLAMERKAAKPTASAQSEPLEPPHAAPVAVQEKSRAPEMPSTAFEEEFLRQMRVRAQHDESELSEDVSRLRRYEHVEFMFFVCLAILTVVFISVGAVLIMAGHGKLTVAIMSGVAGLFTGAGTAIVKGLSIYTTRRREEMSRSREDTNRTSQAIQAAFAIRDPQQRDAEILRLAEWLRGRAFQAAAPPKPAA
jgi:hypothetical protein